MLAESDPQDDPVAEELRRWETAERVRLCTGDIPRCPYCHSLTGHKPGCRGLDVHPECPYCGNVCGHRSATCPGRYE